MTRTAYLTLDAALSHLSPSSLSNQPSSTDLLMLAEHVDKVRARDKLIR